MKLIMAMVKPSKLDRVCDALVALGVRGAECAVEAIHGAARTGRNGDGAIFVPDAAHAVRIRPGEINAAALRE